MNVNHTTNLLPVYAFPGDFSVFFPDLADSRFFGTFWQILVWVEILAGNSKSSFSSFLPRFLFGSLFGRFLVSTIDGVESETETKQTKQTQTQTRDRHETDTETVTNQIRQLKVFIWRLLLSICICPDDFAEGIDWFTQCLFLLCVLQMVDGAVCVDFGHFGWLLCVLLQMVDGAEAGERMSYRKHHHLGKQVGAANSRMNSFEYCFNLLLLL